MTNSHSGAANDRRWPYLAIAAVALAFWLLPVSLSRGLLLDDAELLSVVQSWKLYYDTSQPPLYGWIWLSTVPLFGVSLASTQLVRALLLALLFCGIYRLGCRITGHRSAPFLLLASYIYFPLISWEGTFYQTHTILLNVCTMALFNVVVEIRLKPSLIKYGTLGIIVGLGLLSKYTFVAIVGSVLIAAVSVREYRQALLHPRIAVAALVALAIAAPPMLGFWTLVGEDLPRVVQEISHEHLSYSMRSAIGAWRLVAQYVAQALVFLIAAAVIWGLAVWRTDLRKAASDPELRFFAIQALAVFGIALLAVVALGIDGVTNHHPIPLLLSLPIVAVLAADRSLLLDLPGSSLREWTYIGVAALAVPVVWLALWWTLASVFPNNFQRYAPLAQQIRSSAGSPDATVIVEDFWTAGQLRIHEPGWAVYAADLAGRVALPPRTPRRGGCVVVWRASTGSVPPASFVQYVDQIRGESWPRAGENSTLVASAAADQPHVWRIEPLSPGGRCGTGD